MCGVEDKKGWWMVWFRRSLSESSSWFDGGW